MSRTFKLGALTMVAAILGITAAGFAQPADAHNNNNWCRDARRYQKMQNRAFRNNGFRNNAYSNNYYGATVHPNMYNAYPNYGYGNGYYNGNNYNRGSSGVVGGLMNFLF